MGQREIATIGRILVSLTLAIFASQCAYYAFSLYMKGIGSATGDISVTVGNWRASAGTVGTAFLIVGIVGAIGAYLSRPSIQKPPQ